ncbi:hypothetical protein [Streptomyces sp. NPDC048172]|uniref:hypothetical protein n=1 Tax=Streptomyces sp. NPDC048172 TaxID=3365505 RepID=UPI00371D4749
MTEAHLTPPVLDRVRAGALAWSRSHGDPHPTRARVVATTRDAATRLLHPCGVRSLDEPCYFVVLEGHRPRPGAEVAARATDG